MILVNENYPLDCINDKILFNPVQRQYRVNGQPGPMVAKASPLASSSMVSLLLKSDQARLPKGQLLGEDGDEDVAELITERVFSESTTYKRINDTGIGDSRTPITDALDAAISEARALKDLVSDLYHLVKL